ncbi:MAG TPA: hypothetical protein DCY94_05220 [Firmicutes bacterium]|nr:hypothetical protein [Bacillota bacterium]
MKRKDGFIDLNAILEIDSDMSLEQIHSVLCKNSHIEIIKYNSDRLIFNFNYEGITYFFKATNSPVIYNELLFEEVCRTLGIPCIEQDLAKIGRVTGLISRDYRMENTTYINGVTILEEAGYECVLKGSKKLTLRHNNFEDIFAALKKRYGKRDNWQEIFSNLSKKFIDMFLVDTIMLQDDRHQKNWTIVEFADGKIDLLPLLDNELLSGRPYYNTCPLLSIVSSSQKKPISEVLDDFLTLFPKAYTSLLNSYIKSISRKNLEEDFKKIEQKISHPLPEYIKDMYLERYLIHYSYLEDVLDPQSPCNLFEGSFDKVKKLAERKRDAFGKSYAIGIITPSKDQYVTDELNKIDSIEMLRRLVLQEIASSIEDETARDYITINFTYRVKRKTQIEILVPAYITPHEAAALSKLRENFSKIDCDITINTSNFDPRSGAINETLDTYTLLSSQKDTDIIDELLTLYRLSNRIVEYLIDHNRDEKQPHPKLII